MLEDGEDQFKDTGLLSTPRDGRVQLGWQRMLMKWSWVIPLTVEGMKYHLHLRSKRLMLFQVHYNCK
jgi:hypothetical protein